VILVGADPAGDKRRFNSVPYIESLNEIDASVCRSAPCLCRAPPNNVEKISPLGPNKSLKSPPLKP
jgi:hypothetical protein